jgi:hypothetical protein
MEIPYKYSPRCKYGCDRGIIQVGSVVGRPQGEPDMKPTSTFFGSCGLTALLLAGAVNYAVAQTSSYAAQMAQCREDEIQAEITYANAKTACADQDDGLGGTANQATCLNNAFKAFHATITAIKVRKAGIEGTHKETLFAQDRKATYKPLAGGPTNTSGATKQPSAGAAAEAEHLRHYNALTQLGIDGIANDTDYEMAKLKCDGDYFCLSNAEQDFLAAGRKLDIAINNEDGTNRINLVKIGIGQQPSK